MNPASFIVALRGRDISISATSTGKVRVSPRKQLTPDERAYLAAHAADIVRALRSADLVGSLLASAISEETLLERHTREAVERNSRYAMFQTQRGLLHLEELSDEEATHFASRGKLSEEEVRTWWSWRERRLKFPQETRYQLFLLRARRAGIHRLAVYLDGRVVFS